MKTILWLFKNLFSLFLKGVFLVEKSVSYFYPGYAGVLRQAIVDTLDWDIKEIEYLKEGEQYTFAIYTPNRICAFRANTFFSKEPEILEWIDEFGENRVLYDIGANIGLYSIYYARYTGCRVYSFEPSPFNLRQLAKNIVVNDVGELITIVPFPLSNETKISKFTIGSYHEGGALSAFGVNYGHDGNQLKSEIVMDVPGMCLDRFVSSEWMVEPPGLMKLDVDGIEHLILEGAGALLEDECLKSIYVEVNDLFEQQAESVGNRLRGAGFKLREKRQSEEGLETYNQIWVR